MTTKAKKLLNEALRLAPKEREALAGELFDSLDSTDPHWEAEWQKEIGKRIAELDRGKIKAIPWAQARQLIFAATDDS